MKRGNHRSLCGSMKRCLFAQALLRTPQVFPLDLCLPLVQWGMTWEGALPDSGLHTACRPIRHIRLRGIDCLSGDRSYIYSGIRPPMPFSSTAYGSPVYQARPASTIRRPGQSLELREIDPACLPLHSPWPFPCSSTWLLVLSHQ